MKKKLLFFMVCITSFGYAQVGVETDMPTETLHVKGEMRIENLPVDGQVDAIYTMPDGTRSQSKDQVFKAERSLLVDTNGVVGKAEGKPVVYVESCTKPVVNFDVQNSDYETTVSLGDWEFRWWRATGIYPFLAGNNYFQLRNTKESYHFNSWGVDGNTWNDNTEQDREEIAAGKWTRFTQSFNNTYTGKKLIQEQIVTNDGERFQLSGILYRKTSANIDNPQKTFICMTVQRIGQKYYTN